VTAPRFLLDTNTLIHIRRKQPRRVTDRFRAEGNNATAMSVVTYGELLYGAEKSAQRDTALMQFHELASLVQVLPLTAEAAASYGRIRSELAQKGEIIGANDLWIAAQAESLGLILVTSNVREFRRVRGLRIENWAYR
jgi:tRNA(fMet)-specific endonuclease VapC